jgi:hypothetical protein
MTLNEDVLKLLLKETLIFITFLFFRLMCGGTLLRSEEAKEK